MNYEQEMTAFKDWLLLIEISTSAIALWYTLMSINNSVGWKSRFNAANPVVQSLTGLSKQGLVQARKKLLEHNLIRYEKGKKGRAPVYQMVSLVLSVDLSVDQLVYPSVDESLTIQKEREKEERRRGGRVENPFHLYEKYIGTLTPFAKDEFLIWRSKLGGPMTAVKHAAKHGARTFRYLEKILQEWVANKLTTVEEVEVYLKEQSTHVHNTIPFPRKEEDRAKALFDEVRREGM
ncbi:DnaD domain-containing protein [Oceanobacillus halotolerans]|uniref:DnaD domain-containing protein n=1 Tax=Oceanobacillus halotolerans TaxID=2663380 RepID=UPI0013D8F133|nr:DnaD domain protein [Oceanobacillus halotolerans]